MTEKPDWMAERGDRWTPGESREVYQNPWIRVTEHRPTAPTGRKALYGIVHMKNLALGVLPLHEDGTVTLVGQHRFVFDRYSWELPEGGGPIGEDPLENAKRELAEEAGLAARSWTRVLNFTLSNAVTDERGVGYLATDLYPVPAEPDENEDIAIARVSFREALTQALAGNIDDIITVAMLLRVYHMAREGELPSQLTEAVL
ncbi:MAG TPA: NUDIX hydrolase [Caulobacteraceae bacterium]|nr:NUDIX hydrolase [Caulobacteraceae bacterium]